MQDRGALPTYQESALRRTLRVSIALSAVLCGLFLVVLPISYFRESPDIDANGEIQSNALLSVGLLNISALNGDCWIYTSDLPCYCGIYPLAGAWGGVPSTKHRDWGWDNGHYGIEQNSFIDKTGNSAGLAIYGDFPGIYYRHFEWRGTPDPWTTLAISLWYPIVLFAVAPSLWVICKYWYRLQYNAWSLLLLTTVVAIMTSAAIFVWR